MRKVDLDISHLQKAKVEGRVFLNGEPLTNAQISLATFKGNGSGGRTPASSVSTKTDGEGRFTKRMLSGTYIIFCFKTVKGRIVQLQGEGELQVDAGEDVHRDFHIRTAALRIRLLAADGRTPLSGIEVRGSTVDGAHGFGFSRSDENGHTQLPMMSLGLYELRIWPKRLAKPGVRNKLKLWQQGPDAVRRAQILLGTIRVQAGDRDPQDILVPAEAGY